LAKGLQLPQGGDEQQQLLHQTAGPAQEQPLACASGAWRRERGEGGVECISQRPTRFCLAPSLVLWNKQYLRGRPASGGSANAMSDCKELAQRRAALCNAQIVGFVLLHRECCRSGWSAAAGDGVKLTPRFNAVLGGAARDRSSASCARALDPSCVASRRWLQR
jgi:hypothetical protein